MVNHLCARFGGNKRCVSGYDFSLARDPARKYDQRIEQHYG